MKIELKQVNYIYNKGYAHEVTAVKDVDLVLEKPEFIALVGSTGSGKSTLIQMFNGLLQPTAGIILYDDVNVFAEDKTETAKTKAEKKAAAQKKKEILKELRKKVGLVFQYPENQLFSDTVELDAAFGPMNQGYSKEEALEKARTALRMVGIREDQFEKSPFELSGGEMRRVAIAGVLAMEPQLLILDEPTAGLDPQGKEEILDCIKGLKDKTILFVSHNMEEVAEYADRVIAMNKGRVVLDKPVKEAFADYKQLEEIGLKAPEVTYLCEKLGIYGVTTLEEAVTKIAEKYPKETLIRL